MSYNYYKNETAALGITEDDKLQKYNDLGAFHETCHQWKMTICVISYWNPCFWLVISRFVTDFCYLSLKNGFVKCPPGVGAKRVWKAKNEGNSNNLIGALETITTRHDSSLADLGVDMPFETKQEAAFYA